ncbi:MAG: hypothetical protein PHX70_02860 [Clostridium sp.]|nr:hypothetical protein [Clostridium sp.]
MKGQNELRKGQVPQVVLKHVVDAIYRVVFIEKVTVEDKIGEIFKKMDKLSRPKGYLIFVNPSCFKKITV